MSPRHSDWIESDLKVQPSGGSSIQEALEPSDGGQHELLGDALGCLPPNNAFRVHCNALFRNKAFQGVVLALIVANTVLLAAQGPRHTLGDEFDRFVAAFDVVITAFFTIEMCAGICALGFYVGPNAYLRSPWNVLDLVVVVAIYVSAIALLLFGADIQAAALRTFRALRPLRSLRLFKGLQGIIDALWLTVPYASTVVGLLSFFLLIFCTMGVALFGGTLSRACWSSDMLSTQPYLAAAADGRAGLPTACPSTFTCIVSVPHNHSKECIVIPYDLDPTHTDRRLETKFISFDNILYAFLTLTAVVTMDEWPLISHRLWQSDSSIGQASWWFMATVVVFLSLITVSLFTAVVSYGFKKMRMEHDKSAFTGETLRDNQRTEEQPSQFHDKDIYLKEQPFPFVASLSPAAYDIVHSDTFEYLILSIIVVNAVAMASEYHGMSQGHEDVLFVLELACVIAFTLEMVVKWTGMGMRQYFENRFNCFDCSLVVVGILGVIADVALGGSSSGRVVRLLFKMLRVARLMRLAGKQGHVAILLKTVFSSWSAIANLLVFISFTLAVFAIIGMHTIGYACHGGDLANAPTPRTSFVSFADSLLASFQVMTGEDWTPIMHYYMHCASPVGTAVFFLSIVTVCGFVLVPMFVAVILENFALADEQKTQAQAEEFKSKRTRPESDHTDLIELPQWRWKCRAVAEKKWFERLVLVMILASSVIMALEYPPQQHLTPVQQARQSTLENVGLCFFAGFCLEAFIKVAGYGIVNYMSDPWNRLDFLVIFVGMVDIFFYLVSGSKSSVTRILRLFRVLRPLRLVKRNQGMVVIINALIGCIPMVIGVVGLLSLLFVVFAIVGMQMYMGKMFGCSEQLGPNATINIAVASLNQMDCHDHIGGTWKHVAFFSFDDIFESFKTLFIIATTEGWVDVLQVMSNTPSVVGDPPSENNSRFGAVIYCCMFIIFGALFSTNLFVGVLVSVFGRSSGNALLTESQKRWVQLNMLAMQLAPDPLVKPANSIRRACFSVGVSHAAEVFIGTAVVLNTLMLMLEKFPMDRGDAELLELINLMFLIVFTLECAVKIIGFGPQPYFSVSGLNRLDFVIVTLSWISMAAEGLSVFSGGRALRVFRLLLLLKNTESLKTLLRTLVLSLPAAANITLLLLLVLFVFGIVGMQLFGGLPHGIPMEASINTYDNFDTLPAAVRVLFQITTGQDWVSQAKELEQKMVAADYMGTSLVMPFMVVFYISSVFIFVNLFIAVLLEKFELNFDPDALEVKTEDLDKFKRAWEEFMPPGQMQMPIKSVKRMIEKSDLGVLSQVIDDSQWWPHLLTNIGWDTESEPTAEDVVGFRKLLLALALMYVSVDALPLEERISQAQQLKTQEKRTAARLIHACVVARLHLKRPHQYCDPGLRAANANNPDFWEAYKRAVVLFRNVMVVQIVGVNKISMEHMRSNDKHLLELLAMQSESVDTGTGAKAKEDGAKQQSKRSNPMLDNTRVDANGDTVSFYNPMHSMKCDDSDVDDDDDDAQD